MLAKKTDQPKHHLCHRQNQLLVSQEMLYLTDFTVPLPLHIQPPQATIFAKTNTFQQNRWFSWISIFL